MSDLNAIANLLNSNEPDVPDDSALTEALGGQSEEGTEQENSSTEGNGDQSEQEVTWAGVLGVDDANIITDDNGEFKGLKVKVDGVDSTVSVKELIDGYQFNKHNTQASMALAEEKRAFETMRTTAATEYLNKLETADTLAGLLGQALTSEFNSVDWQKLRVENPSEYAAMQADFQNRKTQIGQLMHAIQSEKQQQRQKAEKEFQGQYQQHLETQYNRTLQNNPSWQDPNVMKKAVTELADFLGQAYGITQQEFSMLNDARHIEIIKDAMAYRKGKATLETKAKTVPKFQQQTSSKQAASKLERLVKRAKTASGSEKRAAQTDAIAELLLNP